MSDAMNGRRRAPAPPPASPSAPARPPLAPPPRRPTEPDDDGPDALTAEQISELRGMLESRRAQLIASIDERREQERDTGREVGDEMDEANTEGVSAMTSKLLERDVNLMREIDRALAKIGEATYGLCEGTGEPIGYSRLKLRPWARYGVEYQEEIERAERSRGV
jgi:DnaK suppressor protein